MCIRDRTNWPARDEVRRQLKEQQTRLNELIEAMAPEQTKIDPYDARDLVGGIIHAVHDEAKHHGEMYLLLKLCSRR